MMSVMLTIYKCVVNYHTFLDVIKSLVDTFLITYKCQNCCICISINNGNHKQMINKQFVNQYIIY